MGFNAPDKTLLLPKNLNLLAVILPFMQPEPTQPIQRNSPLLFYDVLKHKEYKQFFTTKKFQKDY
jgi:hypothetical protein